MINHTVIATNHGVHIMKALAHAVMFLQTGLTFIDNLFVDVNRECMPNEPLPAATYPQFCGACLDMRIPFSRHAYKEYMLAYRDNVANGHDGLRVREYLLLTAQNI